MKPVDHSDEFKVHITEKGTKYDEKILIDDKNDLEYFHVPAHNGLAESDYLYDFKSVSWLLVNRTRGFFCFRFYFPWVVTHPVPHSANHYELGKGLPWQTVVVEPLYFVANGAF